MYILGRNKIECSHRFSELIVKLEIGILNYIIYLILVLMVKKMYIGIIMYYPWQNFKQQT